MVGGKYIKGLWTNYYRTYTDAHAAKFIVLTQRLENFQWVQLPETAQRQNSWGSAGLV
jgi:hypothetical protein